jgi:hypothetical protein
MFQTKLAEKTETPNLCSIMQTPPALAMGPKKNHAAYAIMLKNDAEWGRPQMTIWCMRMACWITKGRDTCSFYVHTSQKYGEFKCL